MTVAVVTYLVDIVLNCSFFCFDNISSSKAIVFLFLLSNCTTSTYVCKTSMSSLHSKLSSKEAEMMFHNFKLP